MSVKISELPILDSLADNDVIAGVDTSANVTSKIEMATLKNYIDTNTQYTAGTNIDITNNVVSAPNVYNKTETDELLEEKDEQIEELQSEVDSLSTIFNAFPTESGEGESLTLDDTAEVKFKKFDLKGNTSQTTYSGKNLIDSQFTTKTLNGVTITNNGDGTYTLNGTSSASSAFALQSIVGQESLHPLITNIKNNVGKYMTLSTGYSSNQGCYLQLNLSKQGGGGEQYGFATSVYAYSNTLITSNESDIAYINFFIGITAGASFNNLKIYPMITIQSSQITPAPTPSDFEPYVGGTASPNPEFPQPINVVSGDNEINVVGKNLIKLKNGSNVSQGVTITINDNKATFVGTPTRAYVGSVDMPLNLKKGTYTFSSTNGVNSFFLWFKNQGGNVFSSVAIRPNPSTITLNEDAYSIQVGLEGLTVGTACNVETYFQLEKGSNATSYEPYQGNTYNIDLPVENLFDLSNPQALSSANITATYDTTKGEIYLNGTSTGTAYIAFNINTIANGSVISFGGKVDTPNSNIKIQPANGGNSVGSACTLSSKSSKLENETLSNSINRIYIIVSSGVTLNNYVIKPSIMLGSTLKGYSPYGTTPIELCKIGNYKDYFYKDSGKWYLHKIIYKKIFNDTDTIEITGSGDTRTLIAYNTGITLESYAGGSVVPNILCTHLISASQVATWVPGDISRRTQNPMSLFYILEAGLTITTALQWLVNNNVVTYTPMAEPIVTELTYEPLITQLNLLEKAQSKENQTNISQVNNDKPFILDVTAIKSLQNVLDRIELLES